MKSRKCVFLDRDGVLNVERGDYTFKPEDFILEEGVPEALRLLKENDYLLVVVTNQGGIGKGLFTREQMEACHNKLVTSCPECIDAIYYAPSHPTVSASLSRKPDSLMLERAIARFTIDTSQSWLVGDQVRDLEAAIKVGVKPILVGTAVTAPATIYQAKNLLAATYYILNA